MLIALIVAVAAAIVLGGAATAQADSEDQNPPASTNLLPICDVFCEPDPCYLDPVCDPDPCDPFPFPAECGPFPGPPDPPEPPEPCTTRQWEWTPTRPIGSINGRVLARPTALFEYCITESGDVRSAHLVQFQANTQFPTLGTDPITGPTPTIAPMTDNGRRAFRVSFPLTYRWQGEQSIEGSISGVGVTVKYSVNDSCTLSVGFTLGMRNPQDTDTTNNPCTQWRPILFTG
jgi:hypothetical protein